MNEWITKISKLTLGVYLASFILAYVAYKIYDLFGDFLKAKTTN